MTTASNTETKATSFQGFCAQVIRAAEASIAAGNPYFVMADVDALPNRISECGQALYRLRLVERNHHVLWQITLKPEALEYAALVEAGLINDVQVWRENPRVALWAMETATGKVALEKNEPSIAMAAAPYVVQYVTSYEFVAAHGLLFYQAITSDMCARFPTFKLYYLNDMADAVTHHGLNITDCSTRLAMGFVSPQIEAAVNKFAAEYKMQPTQVIRIALADFLHRTGSME